MQVFLCVTNNLSETCGKHGEDRGQRERQGGSKSVREVVVILFV